MTESILDLIFQAHVQLKGLEESPRDYGTGEPLYSSDLHTLAAVARREGSNLTELAAELGVSQPAVFKFVKKLTALGYLRKQRREGNNKEVVFFLLTKGWQAVQAHEDFEQRTFGPLRALEAGLSAQDRRTITDFLKDLDRALPR